MGILQVVVDGLYGSCGKGHVAAQLTNAWGNDGRGGLAIRIGGSNAGHTVMGRCPVDPAAEDLNGPCLDCGPWGHPWRLRHIPTAAVTAPNAMLALAAGSMIDFGVLGHEIQQLEAAGYKIRERLFIDPMATVIEPEHLQQEQDLIGQIGSTGKGNGAARAARIMRMARLVRDLSGEAEQYGTVGEPGEDLAHAVLASGDPVLVEAAQGYGLGMHTRFYPYCTSTDCRAIDALAAAGISPWDPAVDSLEVWMAIRPYPIRVAGNSGPLEGETSWEQLGLPAEQTTVTKKTRRVGTWDPDLVREAVAASGGAPTVRLALMMADQISPEIHGVTKWADLGRLVENFIYSTERKVDATVEMVGTGPATVAWAPPF